MTFEEAMPGIVTREPITPAVRACLVRERRIDIRFVIIGAIVVILFARVFLPGSVSWALQSTSHMIAGAIGLAAIISLPILWGRFQIAADLRAGQFSRYSGAFILRRYSQPAQVAHRDYWPHNRRYTWALQLPAGEIVIPSFTVAAIEQAGRGTLDFATRNKTVFEIRDAEGRILFHHPNAEA
ncbi:hypothetical protein [Aquamicrobium sp.]|uniref:hypothetical protein n=1 Tax=Aquamicrobium sp. TaxID=1872579 RepID=UPI0025828F30|nr:hypothetical protein [Aquamicrobium sp.]MCK9549229.1 hypothetical protein [Aquamicrobium sp.]